MIHRQSSNVPGEPVPIPGAEGSQIQWLADKDLEAGFFMRKVTIAPGGVVTPHDHAWEHQMYFLSGQGESTSPEGKEPLAAGAFLFVPPGETHSIENTGREDLVFICCVGPNPEGRHK